MRAAAVAALIPVSLAQEIVAETPDGLGRLAVIPDAARTPETGNPAATFDMLRDFLVTLPARVSVGTEG